MDANQFTIDSGKIGVKSVTKVPYNFQDFSPDELLEFRKNRWNFWELLKKLRNEYSITNHNFDIDMFVKYVEDSYGIKLVLNNTGITDYYEIVDPVKYLLFKLKFE